MSDDNLDAAIAKMRRRMALESVPTPAPALDDNLDAVKAAARITVNAWMDEQIELLVTGRRGVVTIAEIEQKCLQALTEAFAKAVVGHVMGPKP